MMFSFLLVTDHHFSERLRLSTWGANEPSGSGRNGIITSSAYFGSPRTAFSLLVAFAATRIAAPLTACWTARSSATITWRGCLPRSRLRRPLASINSALRLLDPLLGRLGGAVFVVPIPPHVGRGLRVALRRVLPLLLPPQRSHIEVAPGTPHHLVATIVDEISAEHVSVVVANERVMAVPLVHAKVDVEAVCDGVPRHLPTHSRLHALDVRLRRARGVNQRRVASVQMSEVGDLIGP